MAFVHFVAFQFGPVLSLFVDGEMVFSENAPTEEQLKKDFNIYFPPIYGSIAEFEKKGDKVVFKITGDSIYEQDITSSVVIESTCLCLEAVGCIRLPVALMSDDDMLDVISNGNFSSIGQLLSTLGYPKVAEELDRKLIFNKEMRQ